MNVNKPTKTSSAQSENSGKNRQTLPEPVQTAFSDYPDEVKASLVEARALVLQVKKDDPEIGELNETLRWGELSYLTEKPKTGSILRLAMTKNGKPALFFHCGTTLVEQFRAQYSHVFEFEDNRALVLSQPVGETTAELKHCISQALRYRIDQ